MRSRSSSAKPPRTAIIKSPVLVPAHGTRRLGKRSEIGFAIGDRRERVQQVARRSRQPVEPCDHQHVAGVELVEHAAKLRALGLGSARLCLQIRKNRAEPHKVGKVGRNESLQPDQG
jgi:hypothetical protein